MATQEVDTMAAQPSTSKDEPDDEPPLFKIAHNNPKEAATYQDFIFNLDKRVKELDKNYFENSSISTVLDLVQNKT